MLNKCANFFVKLSSRFKKLQKILDTTLLPHSVHYTILICANSYVTVSRCISVCMHQLCVQRTIDSDHSTEPVHYGHRHIGILSGCSVLAV